MTKILNAIVFILMIKSIYTDVTPYISLIGCKDVHCEQNKICTYGFCLT
jgi:hypothetical protein